MKRYAYAHGERADNQQQLLGHLTRLQSLGLSQAQQFGWQPHFIRYSNGSDCTVYLTNRYHSKTFVMRQDGTLTQPAYVLRHRKAKSGS